MCISQDQAEALFHRRTTPRRPLNVPPEPYATLDIFSSIAISFTTVMMLMYIDCTATATDAWAHVRDSITTVRTAPRRTPHVSVV